MSLPRAAQRIVDNWLTAKKYSPPEAHRLMSHALRHWHCSDVPGEAEVLRLLKEFPLPKPKAAAT